nr:MAG TPA: hypothetical protein [Caudoviricetes sp.]
MRGNDEMDIHNPIRIPRSCGLVGNQKGDASGRCR